MTLRHRSGNRAYAITVEFDLADGAFDAFDALIHENARLSLAEEPDCLRFDILTPLGATVPRTVMLYEIYTDRAAFDLHLASRHFKEFDAATRAMVTGKRVVEFDVTENAKPAGKKTSAAR
jgi:(4S)-4-hydroxy-5-phosphonooxypentane-2,3-dione isomerase